MLSTVERMLDIGDGVDYVLVFCGKVDEPYPSSPRILAQDLGDLVRERLSILLIVAD